MTPSDIERIKELLPTTLGSDEIREQIAADILRRSVFSARMASVPYLAKIREVAAALIGGEINQAKAREILLGELAKMGYDTRDPEGGAIEQIKSPVSEKRLNLILDTQRQMASSVARLMSETEEDIEMYPAWELTRADKPAAARKDWPQRWRAAGESVGWKGAYRNVYYGSGVGISFVALKNSPIWAAIGAGVGGFTDTLGNPYPPFAYGSYMDWVDVDRETCVSLGLDVRTAASLSGRPSLSPDDKELLEAAKRVGWPGLFDDLK